MVSVRAIFIHKIRGGRRTKTKTIDARHVMATGEARCVFNRETRTSSTFAG